MRAMLEQIGLKRCAASPMQINERNAREMPSAEGGGGKEGGDQRCYIHAMAPPNLDSPFPKNLKRRLPYLRYPRPSLLVHLGVR